MTPQSQKTILAALRDYKRENLAKARAISEGGLAERNTKVAEVFEAHMAIDDQVELAMQEIVVAR